jgi:NAD(P)-dependent dehydrogenase (short-subunit alcohol dehydrogenase family)
MKRSSLALLGIGALGLLGAKLLQRRVSFEGKVVLITGGSRGLGLALARRWAREGAFLALVARNRAELDRACEDLRARGARAVLPLAYDVRSESQAEEAIQATVSLYGRLDVLVNNAGIMTVGPLETMTNEDYDEALLIHLWAPLYMIRAALRHLRRSRSPRIVNISSFGGKVPVPHMAPYCASKFALTGFSHAVRAELAADGIEVTTVCPGLMRTGSHVNAFFKGSHDEEFAWFAMGMALPGSAMRADRAAGKIVEACRVGRPELVLTLKAKVAVLAHGIFPNTVARVTALVNRFLPQSSGQAGRKSGWDSRGKIDPAFTRRADEATEELNEMRGHTAIR